MLGNIWRRFGVTTLLRVKTRASAFAKAMADEAGDGVISRWRGWLVWNYGGGMNPLKKLQNFVTQTGKMSLMVLLAFSGAAVGAANRPNILFIMSDDHAYQAISAYGDKRHLIETPNIDRIGKEGMRFDRCLVVNSICGPARAACLTGTYNHINGMVNNSNCKFDGSQITYPKLLQTNGYETAIIGKWHLMSDPTGFDFWQILPGQGIYYNPPMIRNGEVIHPKGYVTEIITDAAIDWLKQRDQAKPFLLCVQQKAPHRTWEPNTKDLNFDHDKKYAEPDTLFDDYANRGIAEHDQAMEIGKALEAVDLKLTPAPHGLTPEQKAAWNAYYVPRNEAFKKANPQGKDLVRWKYNRYLHDYLACIKSVDDNVGRLLKYLDDTGLASNTIVVYTADQGFYLGEHGWFDKRWIFEESLRAPLLVRWPGVVKPGTVDHDIVSDIDFAETFLDAAGVGIPERMQGKSMMPVLEGKTPDDWRKTFYYHYYEYPRPHHVRPQYGVVTDRYKLVHFYYDADYWELFDLKKDPQEMKSVFDDKHYAKERKSLEAEVARLRVELKDTNADTALMRGEGGTNYYFVDGVLKERPVKQEGSFNR
jgi:arylsulfatase A-like enzyme